MHNFSFDPHQHSFNTRLPPTGDDEGFHQSQKERAAREDADVYDFASLRDELGGGDEEVNDGLGDQLDEVGDDFNDETFGDDTIGKGGRKRVEYPSQRMSVWTNRIWLGDRSRLRFCCQYRQVYCKLI